MVYRACRRAGPACPAAKYALSPVGRSGIAPTKGQDGAPLYSASALSFRASDRRHWRGNPSLQCGGTHGSRPTECGAERVGRVVRPYTVCHCEPVLTLAWESVPPMRRDTWVPPYRVRRGTGGQSRPPLHTVIRTFRAGRWGRCPLRNLPQNVQRIV